MVYLLNGEESARLKFRIVENSDFDAWIEFFRHPDCARFLGLENAGTPYEQCQEWFRRVGERYKNNLGGMNALIDKNTGNFIGQCGLLVQEVDDRQELEIGYSIIPAYWGKGYATEAAIRCRDFAFQNDFAESIISIIHTENVRSEKVAMKNGMLKERQTIFRDMPVFVYRINKKDWIGKFKI